MSVNQKGKTSWSNSSSWTWTRSGTVWDDGRNSWSESWSKSSWNNGKYTSESDSKNGSFDPKKTGQTNDLPKVGEAPRLNKAPKRVVPPELNKLPQSSQEFTDINLPKPPNVPDNLFAGSGAPPKGNLPQNKINALKDVIRELLDFFRPLGMFVAGAVYQYLRNIGSATQWLFQIFNPLWNGQEQDVERGLKGLPGYNYFWWGQRLGDGAAIVTGILEIVAGSGAAAGGGFLCVTGIGCFEGAPAIVAGVAIGLHGVSTVSSGAISIAEQLGVLYSQGTGGTGGQLYQRMTKPQLDKARNSYQDLIREHEKKLNDYRENPDAYDNDGRLKNAPNLQIRQKIIEGRIKSLQEQIKKQTGELNKIEQELNSRP